MQPLVKIGQEEAILSLEKSNSEFTSLFQSNLLSVEVYKPHLSDNQKPHKRDEFYLVISGTGKFKFHREVVKFKKGDFIFVPAGVDHQFFDFTPDFITWVFFIGEPAGKSGVNI